MDECWMHGIGRSAHAGGGFPQSLNGRFSSRNTCSVGRGLYHVTGTEREKPSFSGRNLKTALKKQHHCLAILYDMTSSNQVHRCPPPPPFALLPSHPPFHPREAPLQFPQAAGSRLSNLARQTPCYGKHPSCENARLKEGNALR